VGHPLVRVINDDTEVIKGIIDAARNDKVAEVAGIDRNLTVDKITER